MGFIPPKILCSSRHVLMPSLLLCLFPLAYFLRFGFLVFEPFFFFFSLLFVFYLWSFLFVAQHIFWLIFFWIIFLSPTRRSVQNLVLHVFLAPNINPPGQNLYCVGVCFALKVPAHAVDGTFSKKYEISGHQTDKLHQTGFFFKQVFMYLHFSESSPKMCVFSNVKILNTSSACRWVNKDEIFNFW